MLWIQNVIRASKITLCIFMLCTDVYSASLGEVWMAQQLLSILLQEKSIITSILTSSLPCRNTQKAAIHLKVQTLLSRRKYKKYLGSFQCFNDIYSISNIFFNVVYIPGNLICSHKQLLMEGYVCPVCYLRCKLHPFVKQL